MKRNLLHTALAIGVVFSAASQSNAQRFPLPIEPSSSRRGSIASVDDALRVAILEKDTTALRALIADDFFETTHSGNTRNKDQFIEQFTAFPRKSLTTDSFQVRVIGNLAIVTGSQTEVLTADAERTFFMRVYVRTQKSWLLSVSIQTVTASSQRARP